MKGLVMLVLLGVVLVSGCIEYYYPLSPMPHRNFNVPAEGAYCENGEISLLIKNNGEETLQTGDFTITVDGDDASSGLTGPILQGENGVFKWKCGGTCSQGQHDIVVVSGSKFQTIIMHCP